MEDEGFNMLIILSSPRWLVLAEIVPMHDLVISESLRFIFGTSKEEVGLPPIGSRNRESKHEACILYNYKSHTQANLCGSYLQSCSTEKSRIST